MHFIETRGNDGQHPRQVTFSQALLSPMASFGGLYVPESLPQLPPDFLRQHLVSPYQALARELIKLFQPDLEPGLLEQALATYDHFDDPRNPVPLARLSQNLFVAELWHGPTRAFKDMALQPFGVLLSGLTQAQDQDALVLAATSGDTGPAALDAFRNRPGVRVACLYPLGGTSEVQRLQMVTESASNLKVIGIHGDFDDAQSALKKLLTAEDFKARLAVQDTLLSAANSVNFGRIIFQLIYHIHAYLELVRQGAIRLGEQVQLNIPSGNFGNALGAWYAKGMGLPVAKILIASNRNNVLTELIQTGRYDLRNRAVINTSSPAMDILKSSNVERILWDLFGSQRTRILMEQLDGERYYQLTPAELARLQETFTADFCSDEEGLGFIREHLDRGYLMDPHTATCLKVQASKGEPGLKSILYSTAEWTKFAPSIAKAIGIDPAQSELEMLKAIAAKANCRLATPIATLFERPEVQDTRLHPQELKSAILSFV
jgi:threonine synthase